MDNFAGKLLDLVGYGVTVTAAATAVGLVVALFWGGVLVPVKYVLFLIGFGLFGYASVMLWRAPSLHDDDDGVIKDRYRDRSPFESVVARVAPPLDGFAAPEERFSPAVKLFVASLFVLGLSLGIEVLFGVE